MELTRTDAFLVTQILRAVNADDLIRVTFGRGTNLATLASSP